MASPLRLERRMREPESLVLPFTPRRKNLPRTQLQCDIGVMGIDANRATNSEALAKVSSRPKLSVVHWPNEVT